MICTTSSIIKHCQIHVCLFRIKLNELLLPLTGNFSLNFFCFICMFFHILPVCVLRQSAFPPGHCELAICSCLELWFRILVHTHKTHTHTLLKFKPATKRAVYAFILPVDMDFTSCECLSDWGEEDSSDTEGNHSE